MIDSRSVLKNSGLRQTDELTKLLGVSRVMVNYYVNKGVTPREEQRLQRFNLVVKTLHDLLKTSKLPLPREYTEDKRQAAVRKIKDFVDQKFH